MSLEANLKQAFDRATRAPLPSVDDALASVLTAHRVQRRNRSVLLAAAGAAALLLFLGGDGAMRWVQSLDREVPPADQSRDVNEQESDADESKLNSPDESTRRFVPDGLNEALSGLVGSDGRAVSVDDGFTGEAGSAPASGGTLVAAGDDHDNDEREGGWRWVPRRQRANWSHAPGDRNSPVTTFVVRKNESRIRVNLEYTGGGGTDRSGVPAEVYEIVDGEKRLLSSFCGDSEQLEVTPGATIEIRALLTGCGSAFYIKGFTIVRFYP